jgi:hypothetical protein
MEVLKVERLDKLLQYLSLLNQAKINRTNPLMEHYINEQIKKVCEEIDKELHLD